MSKSRCIEAGLLKHSRPVGGITPQPGKFAAQGGQELAAKWQERSGDASTPLGISAFHAGEASSNFWASVSSKRACPARSTVPLSTSLPFLTVPPLTCTREAARLTRKPA